MNFSLKGATKHLPADVWKTFLEEGNNSDNLLVPRYEIKANEEERKER